jgi:hypothetical protein
MEARVARKIYDPDGIGALLDVAVLGVGGAVKRLSVSARAKPKASTVIRALDAIERASRWRPLAVFFDEFQEIIENLDERESRHLLGVLRAEIQRHTRVAYLFAGSAPGFDARALYRGAQSFLPIRDDSRCGANPPSGHGEILQGARRH